MLCFIRSSHCIDLGANFSLQSSLSTETPLTLQTWSGLNTADCDGENSNDHQHETPSPEGEQTTS